MNWLTKIRIVLWAIFIFLLNLIACAIVGAGLFLIYMYMWIPIPNFWGKTFVSLLVWVFCAFGISKLGKITYRLLFWKFAIRLGRLIGLKEEDLENSKFIKKVRNK